VIEALCSARRGEKVRATSSAKQRAAMARSHSFPLTTVLRVLRADAAEGPV
jgi:hypothetical protein